MARNLAPPRRYPLLITAVAGLLMIAMAVAWNDHLRADGSTLAGNVYLADVDTSTLEVGEARAVVVDRARRILETPITVVTGSEDVVFSAQDLGFTYDVELAVAKLSGARHHGGFLEVAWSWMTTSLDEITVEDPIGFNPEIAGSALAEVPEMIIEPVVEPVVRFQGNGLLAVEPGNAGKRVDVTDLISRIGRLDVTVGAQSIEAGHIIDQPRVTDFAARSIAESLNAVTEGGAEFLAGSKHATLTTTQIRRHLSASVSNGLLRPQFDVEGLEAAIAKAFGQPVGRFTPPALDMLDGTPVVIAPGTPAPVCCDIGSVRDAADRIIAGGVGPWWLRARPNHDPEMEAWADGSLIVDQVSEFTTPHACCESRVKNIQLIADLVRGAYLIPGETFSLNDYVGERTREAGFVPAGAIRYGRLTDEVGGGVSQFATTIFNAAYFAGLQFDEYQSHSIYFSRYPFGREATISTPRPDLVFTNTTPYPVMIWTTYDDRSITVSMYSTRGVEVVELGQRISRRNQCTHVETDRQRVYPDGRVEVDTVEANYRPAEGIDCNGNVIPRPAGT